MAIRVVVIDGCDLTVLGACIALREDHRFQVIGKGSSLNELLQIVRFTPTDVILLDEWFHNTDVLSVVEEVQTVVQNARIIVTGTLVEGLLIRDLFAAGVKGYLYKGDPLRELPIPNT
jgi:DNA-binding NarL/FixJ family response regulator